VLAHWRSCLQERTRESRFARDRNVGVNIKKACEPRGVQGAVLACVHGVFFSHSNRQACLQSCARAEAAHVL